MMTDSRAFDGWRRLGPSVMGQVRMDDPAGLRQVRDVLADLQDQYRQSLAFMAGELCGHGCSGHVHYTHGEIARELGVSRQAVSKLIKGATS